MRRLAYLFVFALLISMLSAGKADAGFEWCSEDPTFVVNGNVIDLNTTFLASYKSQIKPPVVVELLVPSNAIAAVLTLPGSVPVQGKITESPPAWWGPPNKPGVTPVTVNAPRSPCPYNPPNGARASLAPPATGTTTQ